MINETALEACSIVCSSPVLIISIMMSKISGQTFKPPLTTIVEITILAV
jgi:hypothetical protein